MPSLQNLRRFMSPLRKVLFFCNITLKLTSAEGHSSRPTIQVPNSHTTPATSPTPTVMESMSSMEALTNSLLTSMAAPPPVQTEAATSSFPFSAALAMPHPDESIQKKHEEKLKAAEEKLISLKGILFFVLRDNNFGYR